MEFSHEKFKNEESFNLDQPKQDNKLSQKEFSTSLLPKDHEGVKKDFQVKALEENIKYKFLGDYFQSRAREHVFGEPLYDILNHIEFLNKELFYLDRKINELSEIKDQDITIPPAKKEYDKDEEWKELQEPEQEFIHRKIPLIVPKDEDAERYIMVLKKRKMIIFEEIKETLNILGEKYPDEYQKFLNYEKNQKEENRTN